MGPRLGRVALLSAIVLAVAIMDPIQATAAPSVEHYVAVDGHIDDMWLAEDRCWFSLDVEWSNNSTVVGHALDCMVSYFNEMTGEYDMIRSSQGWQIGDRINCTVVHSWDEHSEWYWIQTTSKGDTNYARESVGGASPFLVAAIVLLALAIIFTALVWNRRRRQ